LHLGETLPPRNSEPRSTVSLRPPTLQHSVSTRGEVIAKILLYAQLPIDALTQTKFQWFASDPPLYSFKKLIVSTLRLLRNLHTLSLAKAVPKGQKDLKCKKITLCDCPTISYVPEKGCVQEMVSSIRTSISRHKLVKVRNFEF
jgi:hypothetical protein